MLETVLNLAPALTAILLLWTGGGKLVSRTLEQRAASTALPRMLGDVRRSARLLRVVGGIEVALAATLLSVPGLLTAPVDAVPAVLTAGLGACFVGYLLYARHTAPDSSCGCSAASTDPIGWRTIARAGLVLLGGLLTLGSVAPWWSTVAAQPAAAAIVAVVAGGLVLTSSAESDRWWLVPLRRARLRLMGHPLGDSAYADRDAPVPVAATVELLERSLAWRQAAPFVRSGLLEHWDTDGWRILRYAGSMPATNDTDAADTVADADATDPRPVSVLFALDATSSTDTTTQPAIRLSVVCDETGDPLGVPVPA